MKRNNYFLNFFIFILILFSCKEENEKENLIGVWSSTRNTNFYLTFDFFEDTIVVHDPRLLHNNFTLSWNLKNSKIYGTDIKNQITDTTIWNFKFNKSKDTLYIKHHDEVDDFYLELKKIENNYEYLENSLGFKLTLPETNKELIEIKKDKNNLNIFLGKQNDSLIIKTDNYQEKIDNLTFVFFSFLDRSNEEIYDTLSVSLLTDISITNIEIDSIKKIIKKLPIKKIYRIYNDSSYIKKDWKANIKWLGRLEESTE